MSEKKALVNESRSWTVSETIVVSHRYTVKGYSLVKGLGHGKYISSDIFTVGGYDWAIRFYPDGYYDYEDKPIYVSIYVAFMGEGSSARAAYDLTLCNLSGRGEDKVYSVYPHIFKNGGSQWGYKEFFNRTELETSPYMKDDSLEFYCTIKVVLGQKNERPNNLSINVPPTNLGFSLKSFLDSGVAWDIEFQVDKETFRAHKQILAARSDVFLAQFFGPIGNPIADKVIVEEIAPPIFDAMLKFIYSDSLPDLEELGEQTSNCSSTVFAQHLLAAADRYGLIRLKLLCEEILAKEITCDTIATTLALAEQYNCLQLKSVCLHFAASKNNIRGVLESEGYVQLKESFPSLTIELLQMVLT